MEKLSQGPGPESISEPEWILDTNNTSGYLFWRRNSDEINPRVKFKHEVEIKEFQRSAHEFFDPVWTNHHQSLQTSSMLSMSMTCFFCITVTVILPWYILIGTG